MSKNAAKEPSVDTDPEPSAVHAWRVSRLTRLGLTGLVAEAIADQVDWHDVARLIHHGCPASLAVSIVA